MTFDLKRRPLRDTVPYVFPALSTDPERPVTLHTRHLGLRTPAVVNAEVKHRRVSKEYDYAEERKHQIETLAAFCVQSWDNVTENGTPAECSPEKVLAFLLQVDADFPEEIEAYRYWAQDLTNFAAPTESPAELKKE